jgi:hypothetical protein
MGCLMSSHVIVTLPKVAPVGFEFNAGTALLSSYLYPQSSFNRPSIVLQSSFNRPSIVLQPSFNRPQSSSIPGQPHP